jgi:TonB family protein
MRDFTTSAGPLILMLKPEPDGQGQRIIFRVPSRKSEAYDWSRGQVSLNGMRLSDEVAIWPGKDHGLLIMTGTGPDRDGATPLRQVRKIELSSPRLTVSIELSDVEKLTSVLEECNRDLLASWGLAPADQDRLATWPKLTNAARFLDDTDYPQVAIRSFQQGEVRVRALVRADGTIGDCVLRYGSGYPALDAATCDAFKLRGRYAPAIDKDGNSLEAPAFATVRWVMPFRPE